MSQHKNALNIIERESGLEGLILRPLSARLLPVTTPEKEGWVDRNKLLDICGRSRKPQINLAKEYDIRDYPCPAGGCLLTDSLFAGRMRDLMKYEKLSKETVNLLKIGRHFRLNPKAKLIVGRDENENNKLINLAEKGDICFQPAENEGPTALGHGQFTSEDIHNASMIVARYTDGSKNAEIRINNFIWPDGKPQEVSAKSIDEMELKKIRI